MVWLKLDPATWEDTQGARSSERKRMWPERATKCPVSTKSTSGRRVPVDLPTNMTESEDLTQYGQDPAQPYVYPRPLTENLPVTGAWQEGDPEGNRQFAKVHPDRSFALEGGGVLKEVTMAYETWGQLSPEADNAILVCHALTGDSHAFGEHGEAHPTPGWWNGVIGEGSGLDPKEHFIVCINVLGGCQGSTGPASINPDSKKPYGSAFPVITTRDMVRAQAAVADHLGIEQWRLVVGGSMGGMQVLEWGIMYPDRVKALAPLATALAASPWQIGWSAVGRNALVLDPLFRGGDYYDAEVGNGPHLGLATARSIAQIHYRSPNSFAERFGREVVDPRSIYGLWDQYQVESYLDYQGEKLVRRFDANSYLVLNRAMDLHDVARDRGSVNEAVSRLARVPVLTLSITSDYLYPPNLQVEIFEAVKAIGGECTHQIVENGNGHDGFLLATEDVSNHIAKFLEDTSI